MTRVDCLAGGAFDALLETPGESPDLLIGLSTSASRSWSWRTGRHRRVLQIRTASVKPRASHHKPYLLRLMKEA